MDRLLWYIVGAVLVLAALTVLIGRYLATSARRRHRSRQPGRRPDGQPSRRRRDHSSPFYAGDGSSYGRNDDDRGHGHGDSGHGDSGHNDGGSGWGGWGGGDSGGGGDGGGGGST